MTAACGASSTKHFFAVSSSLSPCTWAWLPTSVRFQLPSSSVSAREAALPSAICGSQCSFCVSLAFWISACVASVVATKGEPIKCLPMLSAMGTVSASDRPRPPYGSGTVIPNQPRSTISCQTSALIPSLCSICARTRSNGECLRQKSTAVSMSMVCSSENSIVAMKR